MVKSKNIMVSFDFLTCWEDKCNIETDCDVKRNSKQWIETKLPDMRN